MAVATKKSGASVTAKRGVSTSVKERTGSIAALWNKAKTEAKTSGFSDAIPLEPGKYTAQLVHAEIGKFNNEKKLLVRLCVVGMDEDVDGTICTLWFALEGDNIVWTAKAMGALGVDLDSTEINEADDILAVFNGLIEGMTVAACQVKLKGEHTNMYVNGLADVDSDALVDPEAVMEEYRSASKSDGKSAGKKGSKAKDDAEDASETEEAPADAEEAQQEGEGVEVVVGSRVTWMNAKTKKRVMGEIIAFDADDNAVIRPDGSKKTETHALDELELVEEAEEATEEAAEEEAAVEVDSVVKFKQAGKSKTGVVKKLDSKFAHLKVSGSPTLVKVAVGEVELVTE